MNRLVTYLLRFAVILVGYVVASLAASAFIHLIFLATAGFEPRDAPTLVAGSLIFSIPFVALFVAYFAFIPASAVVLIGEGLNRRDWLFYALGGGVVAVIFLTFVHKAADPDFEVTNGGVMLAVIGGGMVGGIGYWASAGRWAGHWRPARIALDETPPPTSPGPSGS